MYKGYTKQITQKIAQMATGAIITVDDFPAIPRGTAVTLLNRIALSDKSIVRVKHGVFSKAEDTALGLAHATVLEVLSKEVTGDNHRTFGGLFLFNQLGLTTQVPSIIEILNNRSSYRTFIGSTIVKYVKIYPRITLQSKPYIVILEVIKKTRQIPDGDLSKTIQWVDHELSMMSTNKLKTLVKVANEYPPRVRAILGSMLISTHARLSKKIQKTLKTNSYYRVGHLVNYLNDPKPWRLKP